MPVNEPSCSGGCKLEEFPISQEPKTLTLPVASLTEESAGLDRVVVTLHAPEAAVFDSTEVTVFLDGVETECHRSDSPYRRTLYCDVTPPLATIEIVSGPTSVAFEVQAAFSERKCSEQVRTCAE
jgi:hypothetical protein